MKTTRYALAVALGVIALLAPNAVRADTVYTYTGATFTTFSGSLSCPMECSIDGSMTFSGSLMPNTTYHGSSTNPLLGVPLLGFDFFISGAGTPSWTNTNGAAFHEFSLTTDASDNIIGWDIAICAGPCGLVSDPVSRLLPPDIVMCNTPSVPPGTFTGSDVCLNVGGGGPTTLDSFAPDILKSARSTTSGTWSAPSPVPEPSLALLLATGILGVMVMKVQRRKSVA